jgi:hypothetical protein
MTSQSLTATIANATNQTAQLIKITTNLTKLIMMMDFSEDSLATRRSIRLQEVAKMEATAVGRSCSFMVLDTSAPNLQRNTSQEMTAERRPSDTEIRSLWRLRVMALKMDESGHSARHSLMSR